MVPIEEIKGNNGGISHKFKAGDWVVCGQYGAPCQIESIKDGRYYFTCGIGITVESVNIDYHLWTIQDAKDGDVLLTKECEEPKIVFILKGNVPKNCVCGYYCYYNIMYPHFATDKEKGCLAPESMDLIPATKEQRDLLFAKMEESGYKWDAEKKELSHSEEPPTVYRDELTEFDHKLCLMFQKFRYLDQPVTNGDILEYVEKNSKELQAIARKQIADKAIEFVKTHICMFKSMEEVDLFNELFEKNIKGE